MKQCNNPLVVVVRMCLKEIIFYILRGQIYNFSVSHGLGDAQQRKFPPRACEAGDAGIFYFSH